MTLLLPLLCFCLVPGGSALANDSAIPQGRGPQKNWSRNSNHPSLADRVLKFAMFRWRAVTKWIFLRGGGLGARDLGRGRGWLTSSKGFTVVRVESCHQALIRLGGIFANVHLVRLSLVDADHLAGPVQARTGNRVSVEVHAQHQQSRQRQVLYVVPPMRKLGNGSRSIPCYTQPLTVPPYLPA